MRRSQRTGRQHYLAAGARLDHPVALPHPDAGGAATFHNQPKRLRAGEDMKVRTPLGGFQEGGGAAAAAAVPHGHLKVTDAFLVFAVVIIIALVAEPLGSIDPGINHRTGDPAFRHVERTACTSHLGWTTLPVFCTAEQRHNIVPAPADIAKLAPLVEILRLATNI